MFVILETVLSEFLNSFYPFNVWSPLKGQTYFRPKNTTCRVRIVSCHEFELIMLIAIWKWGKCSKYVSSCFVPSTLFLTESSRILNSIAVQLVAWTIPCCAIYRALFSDSMSSKLHSFWFYFIHFRVSCILQGKSSV